MNHNSNTPNSPDFDEDFLEWEERDNSIPYLTHCIAGSIAGITEHVTMLPVDTVKTHMQVFKGKYSAMETARKLYKNEGILKFWRGASVLASGCIPAHALYFSVYEFSKLQFLPKFHDTNNKVYPYAYAITGALATSIHDLVLTPFDMLKQRTQLAPKNLTGLSDLFGYIVKNEGFFSLFRGYPITLFMNVPQAAAIVSVNESLKVMYRPEKGHNVLSYFMCAGLAGSVAAILTIPLDNVKTRLQTQTFFDDCRKPMNENKENNKGKNGGRNTAPKKAYFAVSSAYTTIKAGTNAIEREIKYRDITSTIRTILREEGAKGFVKGIFPRILAQAPASAISWTTYEMMKKLLKSSKQY
jgi:hypothetical protein